MNTRLTRLLLIISIVLIAPQTALSASVIDFRQLYHYGLLAESMYEPAVRRQSSFEQQGYKTGYVLMTPNDLVACILAINPATQSQVIVLRGTANLSNTLLNLDFELRYDDKAKIQLHNGYAQAARSLYQQLKPLLKPEYRITAAGHSLGGAVAVILAMYLSQDGYPLDQVVTFGQPKLTNSEGAVYYKNLKLTRVVTPKDPVPLVPAFDPMKMQNLEIYWHLGDELVLHNGRHYAILKGIDSMLRGVSYFFQEISDENLTQHQMSVYRQQLAVKMASPGS